MWFPTFFDWPKNGIHNHILYQSFCPEYFRVFDNWDPKIAGCPTVFSHRHLLHHENICFNNHNCSHTLPAFFPLKASEASKSALQKWQQNRHSRQCAFLPHISTHYGFELAVETRQWIPKWRCISGCIAFCGKKYGCGNYGFVKSQLWKSKSKSGTQCKRIDFKSGKSDLHSTAAVDPIPKP